MAGTTPRNGTTAELVTESMMDTHVRDNLLAVYHPQYKDHADKTVVSSTSEVTLLTAAPSIPAGEMGTNGAIFGHVSGVVTKNTTGTLNIRIKLGGTTLIDSGPMELNTSASVCAGRLEFWIHNRNSASAQWTEAMGWKTESGTPSPGAGSGGWIQNGSARGGTIVNTSAVNTASAATLDVTAQWSASSASLSITKGLGDFLLRQG